MPQETTEQPSFDLQAVYVQLLDGPEVTRVEVRPGEMHPAGDELVYLLSGEVEVRQPGRALHVTRGKGTAHRPL